MKIFFKVILFIITIIIACCIFINTCTHNVTYTGIVLSHNVTSDKYGNITYYTVAKFNDGYIRSLDGLEYYTVQIGDKVYFTINKLN
jgi:hypothetical protein